MSGPEGLSIKTQITKPTVTLYRSGQANFNTPQILFNTGPVTKDDLFLVRAGGLLAGGSTWSTRATLWRRTKNGGVWSALENLGEVTRVQKAPKSGFGFVDLLAGIHDDVEYSIVAQIVSGTSLPTSSSTVASDFFFTSQVA
jgi:hypothetical protein